MQIADSDGNLRVHLPALIFESILDFLSGWLTEGSAAKGFPIDNGGSVWKEWLCLCQATHLSYAVDVVTTHHAQEPALSNLDHETQMDLLPAARRVP